MKFQFIAEHRDQFAVTMMCRVLEVSSGGYYAWRKRPVSAREMANQHLVEQIRAVHTATEARYGSPRISRDLKSQGVQCSENRVARLLRCHGIRARQMKRRKVITNVNPEHTKCPNLVQQQFSAAEANTVWCSDITYIWTRERWFYLAVVLDLFSRASFPTECDPQQIGTPASLIPI